MPTDPQVHDALARFSSHYSDWVSLHSAPPETLFHYTTGDGLLAMLQSRHIWATDSRFMNDPTELLYAMGLLRDIISSELANSRDEPRRELAAWIEKMLCEKGRNARIYLASFCSNGDLLSQWRGYGASGRGYALGFNPHCLFGHELHERPPWRVLRRVIYEPEDQRRVLRAWIDDLAAPGIDMKHALATTFPTLFAEWLTCFKHPSYREEGEWRLIQFGREFDGDPSEGKLKWWWPAKFRTRNGDVIPFADIDLSGVELGAADALFREIVLGPTVDTVRAEKALRLCCELGGVPAVTFSSSAIPFVL